MFEFLSYVAHSIKRFCTPGPVAGLLILGLLSVLLPATSSNAAPWPGDGSQTDLGDDAPGELGSCAVGGTHNRFTPEGTTTGTPGVPLNYAEVGDVYYVLCNFSTDDPVDWKTADFWESPSLGILNIHGVAYAVNNVWGYMYNRSQKVSLIASDSTDGLANNQIGLRLEVTGTGTAQQIYQLDGHCRNIFVGPGGPDPCARISYGPGAFVDFANPEFPPFDDIAAYEGGVTGFDDLVPRFAFGQPPPPEPSACNVSDVSIELDLAGVMVPRLSLSLVTAFPGDSINWRISTTRPFDITENSFRFRTNPADAFESLPVSDPVIDANEWTWTYGPFDVDDATAGNRLEIECTPSFLAESGRRFYAPLTASWNLEPSLNSACSSLLLTRPSGEFESGQTLVFPYTFGPGPFTDGDEGVAAIVVDIFNDISAPDHSEVFSDDRFGSNIGGPPPQLHVVPADTSGVIRFVAPWSNAYENIRFTCTDSTGTTRLGGSGNYNGAGTDGSFEFDREPCVSGAGMTLDPRTWPSGFFPMILCAASELVIPSDGFVADWVSSEADRWSNEPPFIFVAAGVEFAQETHAALVDPTADGCFDFDFGGDIGPVDTCLGSGVDTTSYRPLMALLLIAPIILGVIAHAFSLVRSPAAS